MHPVLDFVVTTGKEMLLPFMTLLFLGGLATRALIQFTVKREQWFVTEFEKRMAKYVYYENPRGSDSFYVTLKRLLEKTFYELFEVRSVMRRRKMDHVMAPMDRVFLIQQGTAYMVRDTLRYASTLRKDERVEEKDELLNVSKLVMQGNPCFSKVFGVIPAGPVNDFLNQTPSLFIVLGIFGTFLGIMKALPELGGVNPADAEGSKAIMDAFLLKIAFSMSTSATGIFFSVVTQTFNSFINPSKLFVQVVKQYEESLHQLWRNCEDNSIPSGLSVFDENRDPKEALAELALQKELTTNDKKKKTDQRATPQGPSFGGEVKPAVTAAEKDTTKKVA